jgi:hypothetical protein
MQIDEALDILKCRLESIDGLTVTTDPAVTIVAPMAVITDGEIDYDFSFGRGAVVLSFQVTVYVAQSDSTEGLYEARRYLSGHGDRSVREALDTPSTTDDLLSKVTVNTGIRSVSDNYITAEFTCSSHVPGATAT